MTIGITRRVGFGALCALGLGAELWANNDALIASSQTDEVVRYDLNGSLIGIFVTSGAGGLDDPAGLRFGPDGNLYVSSRGTDEVLRYDGSTGAFVDVFVSAGSGGLSEPESLRFHPDGRLLVASKGSDAILAYDASSGVFDSVFSGDDAGTVGIDESGGLSAPRALEFSSAGHLLVSTGDAVMRFHGLEGRRLGTPVRSGNRSLSGARGLAILPGGGAVVASQGTRKLIPIDGLSGPLGPGPRPSDHLLSTGGLGMGPDGLLWVTDPDGDCVRRYTTMLRYVDDVVPASAGTLDQPEDLAFFPPQPRLLTPLGASGASGSLDVYGATPGATLNFYEARTSGRATVPDCGGMQSFLKTPTLLGSAVAAGDGTATLSYFLDPDHAEERRAFQVVDTTACSISPIALYRIPDSGSRAICVIEPGGNINTSSTFNTGSFRLRNSSNIRITKVRLDLSGAILIDQVYDPFGDAGDATAKDVKVDRNDGVGFLGHYYEKPHDGGFDSLVMEFNDFDFDEIFEFSVDCDPTSIKGASSPGPEHSGSVNGFECVAAKMTYFFEDGSQKKRSLWRYDASVTGGRIALRPDQAPAPRIKVLGVSDPELLTEANQVVRVRGTRGEDVSLLVVECGLYLEGVPGGGFDIDPFESNKAIRIEQFEGTVGTDGYVDFPIVLQKSDPEAGLYSIVAAEYNASDVTGRTSRVLHLQYDDS